MHHQSLGSNIAFTGSSPVNGSLTAGANGRFTNTPGIGFAGTDSFTVTVGDGRGGTASQISTVLLAQPEARSNWRLFAGDGFKGELGNDGAIFGTGGIQDITLANRPRTKTFDASFNRGGDRIVLDDEAALFSASLNSSNLLLGGDDASIALCQSWEAV